MVLHNIILYFINIIIINSCNQLNIIAQIVSIIDKINKLINM